MKQPADDPDLDRLLVDWAKQHEPADERFSELQRQLHSSMSELAPEVAAVAPVSLDRRRKVQWFGLGAATGLAAGVALVCVFWMSRSEVPNAPASLEVAHKAPREAGIDAKQASAKSVLMAEMGRLFPDQVAWVAETDDDVQFKLNDAASESTSKSLEVRLLVMSRRIGDKDWTARWKLDVAARQEEPVYLDRSSTNGQEGRASVWMLPMTDSRIYVETSLSLSAPLALTTTVCGVQDPGTPVRILWLKSGDQEYEVYQTVAVLPAATASTDKSAKPGA